MKSIVLIRHTKSDWNGMEPDFDRPIREDRKADAACIAREIKKKGFHPDHVAVSPAKRTLQTAEIICDEWHYKFDDAVRDKSLYESSYREILSFIRSLDKNVNNAVVVCHNPSISEFVRRYADNGVDEVPTTGAVLIKFDVSDWDQIDSRGHMEWFLTPKELRK